MTKTKSRPKEKTNLETSEICNIILYNDDVNTFDFVIETLMEVCNHEYIQAVQCAHLVHHTGKCSVRRGSFKELKRKYEAMIDKGLSATIE